MRTSWTKLCIDAMNPLSLAPTGVQYWPCEAGLIIGIKIICLESPSVSALAFRCNKYNFLFRKVRLFAVRNKLTDLMSHLFPYEIFAIA